MTEPDPHGVSEDFGSIEIFGIPFSTFTRSVVMGLEEFGLCKNYIQHHTKPHSGEVVQRNPFGLLPVLVHRPDTIYTSNADAIVLYESNAIRRYIDEWLGPQANKKFNTKVELTPKASHTPGQINVRAKVDQWVSIASTVLFPAVELGVVKPRLAMEDNGADDETIRVALDDGIARLHDRLATIEQLLAGSSGDFFAGSQVTWADLFAYPPLADLRAVQEGEVLRNSKEAVFPHLAAWMDRMEARTSAKNTFEGTLAANRKK